METKLIEALKTLTELETKALAAIASVQDEENFSTCDIGDVAAITKLSKKALRGVISSLVQKGLVEVEDYEGNSKQFFYYVVADLYNHFNG